MCAHLHRALTVTFSFIHSLTPCLASLCSLTDSNDVHILDSKTMEWSRLTQRGELPKPRAYHSAAVVGNFLVVMGGWSGQVRRRERGSSSSTPSQATPSSAHPARLLSSLTHLPLSLLPQCENLASLSTLDLDGLGTWASVAVPGQPPAGNYGHTATVLGSNILVFGGWDGVSPLSAVNVLDTTKL